MTLPNRRAAAIGLAIVISSIAMSCSDNEQPADAFGTFEVDEVTISSKVGGALLQFEVMEGALLDSGVIVGLVDTTDLHLQRAEVAANLELSAAEKATVQAQLTVAENDVARLTKDARRIQAMYNEKAATQKQLDDITSGLESATRSLDVLRSRYPAIDAQAEAIRARQEQLEQRLRDAVLTNPSSGVVLIKFAEQHEMIAPGKPLYTIADLSSMYLKAYVSGEQLAEISLGQSVTVLTDAGSGTLKEDPGTISWISSVAEFTPKNIQTREERVALVYAIKIRVANAGTLKIGMPGEVRWSAQ